MKQIIIFGAGNLGKTALHWYGKERVYCFCDNQSDGHSIFYGKKVIDFPLLKNIYTDYCVVLAVQNSVFVREMASQLRKEHIPYTLFLDEYEKAQVQGKNNMEVFSDIYHHQSWGRGKTEFYSGPGSHEPELIGPYIQLLQNLIINNNIHVICEVGCGDFNIMGQVLANMNRVTYSGIDVVSDLIDYNIEKFGQSGRSFVCMDAAQTETKLPQADLLIIRQVLQHLDNHDVQNILVKASQYPFVLVTEDIYEGEDVIYNLDKVRGASTRVLRSSGIYLEKPPFGICHMVHLLMIPVRDSIIRTSLIINQ